MLISNNDYARAISRAVIRLGASMAELGEQIRESVGAYQASPEIAQLEDKIQAYRRLRFSQKTKGEPLDLPDEMQPLVVAALRLWRLEKASNLEKSRSKLVDRSVIAKVEDEFRVLEELFTEPWVQKTPPTMIPSLVDNVTLDIAERALRGAWNAEPRAYDEKFRTLQAPQLLDCDLSYFRAACAMRGTSVGLAFADIDHFKTFNSEYGEAQVDLLVLPSLMRTLETIVFGRGYAYRQGGDEYVLCIPNVDSFELRYILKKLLNSVRGSLYRGVPRQTTLSVGYVLLGPRSVVTNNEALAKAVEAKQAAKVAGRDRVAGFDTEPFTGGNLAVDHDADEDDRTHNSVDP